MCHQEGPWVRVIGQRQSEESESASVMSTSSWPDGLLGPWNSPGQNSGVGSRSLHHGIFSTQGRNPGLPHYRWILYQLSHREAQDNLETNLVTTKPETVNHVAEQSSWVPLPYCSLPRHPFLINSLNFSAHVSPKTIHFWVLDKSPLLRTGRGLPFCLLRQQVFYPDSASTHVALTKSLHLYWAAVPSTVK